MKTYLATTALLCLMATTPALAQTATGTGTGVGVAKSSSQSGALAISGQGGQGGNSALTINSTTPATTTSNINQTVSGSTTTRSEVSGTQTLKNVPIVSAPGLSAAGLETCLGSASGGVGIAGFGISGGSTYRDEDCTARLDSRTLYSMGLKSASVARLCVRPDIWRSMPDICERYWPRGQPLPQGVVVAAPLVAPSGTYMSTDSGTIRVIDGRDGIEKDCVNYSATKLKCYQWAGERAKRQHSAALTPAKSQVKPQQPKKPPAVEAIETAAPAPSNQ